MWPSTLLNICAPPAHADTSFRLGQALGLSQHAFLQHLGPQDCANLRLANKQLRQDTLLLCQRVRLNPREVTTEINLRHWLRFVHSLNHRDDGRELLLLVGDQHTGSLALGELVDSLQAVQQQGGQSVPHLQPDAVTSITICLWNQHSLTLTQQLAVQALLLTISFPEAIKLTIRMHAAAEQGQAPDAIMEALAPVLMQLRRSPLLTFMDARGFDFSVHLSSVLELLPQISNLAVSYVLSIDPDIKPANRIKHLICSAISHEAMAKWFPAVDCVVGPVYVPVSEGAADWQRINAIAGHSCSHIGVTVNLGPGACMQLPAGSLDNVYKCTAIVDCVTASGEAACTRGQLNTLMGAASCTKEICVIIDADTAGAGFECLGGILSWPGSAAYVSIILRTAAPSSAEELMACVSQLFREGTGPKCSFHSIRPGSIGVLVSGTAYGFKIDQRG
jgi:hypothetical protein